MNLRDPSDSLSEIRPKFGGLFGSGKSTRRGEKLFQVVIHRRTFSGFAHNLRAISVTIVYTDFRPRCGTSRATRSCANGTSHIRSLVLYRTIRVWHMVKRTA